MAKPNPPLPGDEINSATLMRPQNLSIKMAVIKADGSREIIRAEYAVGGDSWIATRDTLLSQLGEDELLIFWTRIPPNDNLGTFADLETPGTYLPYPPGDGTTPDASDDPVNQIPYLQEWRGHIGRMMHGWDHFHSTKAYSDVSSSDRDTLEKQIISMAGVSWEYLKVWGNMVDDTGKPHDNWLSFKQGAEDTVTVICDVCNSETWARRLARNINFSEFKTKLDRLKVWSVNQDTTPWTPGREIIRFYGADNLQTIPEATSAAFFNNYRTHAEDALDYYDEHVSHTETQHGHDD